MSALSPRPRARVVIVADPEATCAFTPDSARIHDLVERGLTNLVGQATVAAAWLSLVSTQDVVGIKVFTAPGPNIGTRVPVVEAVVRGLLSAGLPAGQIIIWDRHLDDLKHAGFVELAGRHRGRLAGSVQAGWDEKTFYESALLGQLVFGDLEFNKKDQYAGRKSFVSKLVTQRITKIINIPPLLNHNSAGVCGNLYSLALGSVDNELRFEGDLARLAQAVPEIYALPALGDRVVLNIVDALICQYEGEHVGRLHYSTALNQLRFSTDPVALDVLSIEELSRQRESKGISTHAATNALELYRIASLLEIGVSAPSQILVEDLR